MEAGGAGAAGGEEDAGRGVSGVVRRRRRWRDIGALCHKLLARVGLGGDNQRTKGGGADVSDPRG
jgi:hypothetical protein